MNPSHQQRAEQLHDRAVEAAARGHFAVASRLSRQGLEAADAESEVRARTLLTFAWAEAEQARIESSLELLDQAELAAAAHPRITGLTVGQRGVLLLRLGRSQQARDELARAVPLLAQQPVDQARALLNKGVADLECHDFGAARTSFERCGELAGQLGLTVLVAKAESNLGLLTGLRGDLPAALRHFELATEQFGDAEPVLRAGTVVDSGFVLTAAGLLAEAERELLAAVQVLARAGVRLTEAEAWLSLAEIALVAERLPDAQQYARRAERGFSRRGSVSGVLLSEAVLAATAAPRGRLTAQHLARLRSVAGQLDAAGFREESTRLRLRAARRVGRSGRLDRAGELLVETRSATRARSLHTRLLARTVRAELAQAKGDTASMTREIRAGLADLQRHQSRLGSIDLQTSVVRHGSDLAGLGLRLAVSNDRPAAVLTWLERTRALTTRIPPILPPDDQVMADLLGALRHQRLELRQLELDREATAESIAGLRDSCLRLERAAAARERQLIGSGDVIAEVTPAEVRSALADSGAGHPAGVLISFFDVDAEVHALVLTPDRAELVALGPLAPVEAQIHRVRADLDVLALASTPAMMRAIVRASLGSGLAKLDAALWQPVAPLAAAGPVALIPTGRLTTLPWTLLPGLRGRPVTVARSPGEWLRGRQWPAPGGAPRGRAVFATGPRVDRAAEEIRSAAAAWPEAELMPLATPMALLARVAGADLVHIAAHGTHDAENPLFSSLELTGGLLFGHDLTRVRPAPRHVVLSACDLGLATARAGSESLGMTAALLHGGTTSVVSGVARVADDIACDVAVAYHQRLSAGERPSYALAAALADTGADGSGESPAPLTCFGSGW